MPEISHLQYLSLSGNQFGDEGLAALVGGDTPTGVLMYRVKVLHLNGTQITDAGCAALAAALVCGALFHLETLSLNGIPASAAAQSAVFATPNLSRVGNYEVQTEPVFTARAQGSEITL